MPNAPHALASIHFLSYHGKKKFGDHWQEFISALRRILRRTAVEQPGSSEVLLIFSFQHPYTAFSLVLAALAEAKKEAGLRHDAEPLPLQLAFHLDTGKDPAPHLADSRAEVWNFLKHETPYITRAMKNHWHEVTAGRTMPEHQLEKAEDHGLFQLTFTSTEKIRVERLFPHRALALHGDLPHCYYCGMKNHAPKTCPSKLLPHDSYALPLAGAMTTEDLSSFFSQSMSRLEENRRLLVEGFDPESLRENPTLIALHSYFDIFKLFQTRFLLIMSFNSQLKWYNADKFELGKIDNRTVHLALDCLRVGNLAQSEELLMKEVSRFEGKQFCAAIGLAFIALEKGRLEDMATWLDRGKNLAGNEKEQIYCALLTARLHFLRKDYFKAKDTIEQGKKIKADCSELLFLNIELESSREQVAPDTAKQLGKLVEDDPYLFLAALLDPHLLPIEGFVEGVLHSVLASAKSRILDALAKAEEERTETAAWLAQEDEELRQLSGELATLRSLAGKTGYFALLELETRIKTVSHALKNRRDLCLEELENAFKREDGRANRLAEFWKTFPCQILFSIFSNRLREIKKTLRQSAGRPNDDITPGRYREMLSTCDKVHADLSQLEERMHAMHWVCSVIHGVRVFIKKLAIAELILVPLFFGLAHALSLAPGIIPALVSQDFAESLPLRVAKLAALVLAPTLALMKTWKALSDS